MNIQDKLEKVPAKKLRTSKSLLIFWRLLLTNDKTMAKSFFSAKAFISLATIIGVVALASSYAYAQPNIKNGDLLFPAKQLGEQIVSVSTFGSAEKASLYQSFAERRVYEAGLFLQADGQALALISKARAEQASSTASTSTDFNFKNEHLRNRFLWSLRWARNWTERAIAKASTIEDPAELDKLLNKIGERQELQVEKLNTIIDKLGLDTNKVEVDSTLDTIAQAQTNQDKINATRQLVKEAVIEQRAEIKDQLRQQIQDRLQEHTSTTAAMMQNRLTAIEQAIARLNDSNLSAEQKEKIIDKLKDQTEKLDEWQAKLDDKFNDFEDDDLDEAMGHSRAWETYGMFKAEQNVLNNAINRGDDDKSGMPFRLSDDNSTSTDDSIDDNRSTSSEDSLDDNESAGNEDDDSKDDDSNSDRNIEPGRGRD